MKLPLTVLAAVSLGLAVGAILAPRGLAQVRTDVFSGGGHGGNHIERIFRFKSIRGNQQRIRPQRQILVVPEEYGEVFTVTRGAQTSTLWYRNEQGIVRNVILSRPDALIVATNPAGVPELRKTHGK